MSTMFPTQAAASTSSTSPDVDAQEKVEVDMDTEVEATNPDADFNERLPPPEAGAYLFKWEINPEKPIQPSQTKPPNSTPFLNVWITGRMISNNPEDDGTIVNYYLNSLINRKKGTSEVHHFLNLVGSPIPVRIKLGELKTVLEEVLAKNPISPAKYEWRCSYKDPNKLDKKGNPEWVEQLSRMDQFPPELDETTGKPTGKRSNVVKSKLDGTELFAQGYIPNQGLLTDADYKKLTS